MENGQDGDREWFHATVGDVENLVEARESGDPRKGEIHVHLGGALATREDASALAAELEELVMGLVSEVRARRADEPTGEPRPDRVSVSLEGLELDGDEVAAIKRRVLAHVRDRVRAEPAPGPGEEAR